MEVLVGQFENCFSLGGFSFVLCLKEFIEPSIASYFSLIRSA